MTFEEWLIWKFEGAHKPSQDTIEWMKCAWKAALQNPNKHTEVMSQPMSLNPRDVVTVTGTLNEVASIAITVSDENANWVVEPLQPKGKSGFAITDNVFYCKTHGYTEKLACGCFKAQTKTRGDSE